MAWRQIKEELLQCSHTLKCSNDEILLEDKKNDSVCSNTSVRDNIKQKIPKVNERQRERRYSDIPDTNNTQHFNENPFDLEIHDAETLILEEETDSIKSFNEFSNKLDDSLFYVPDSKT